MVKRRKLRCKEKSRIVLEGLNGRPDAQICQEHQISQSMYYVWREQLLTHMDKASEVKKADQREVYAHSYFKLQDRIILWGSTCSPLLTCSPILVIFV